MPKFTKFQFVLISIMCIGALLRVFGIFNDFSLDEIWSYNIFKNYSSLFDALTRSKDENAHPITLLFMYFLGDRSGWWVYRLLSLIAGLATLIVIYNHVREKKRVEALTLSLFWSLSYLMVLYASEARGYAPMLFFVLAAWLQLRKFIDSGRLFYAITYQLALILGICSHLSAIQFFLASVIWSTFILSRYKPRFALSKIALAHLLSVVFVALVFFSYIVNLQKGSGNIYSPFDLIVNIFCVSFNAPILSPRNVPIGIFSMLLCIFVAILLFRGIFEMWKRADAEWSFYLLIIFIVPTVSVLAMQRLTLEPRYFLIPIVFAYFLGAKVIQGYFDQDFLSRCMAVTLLVAFTMGGFFYFKDFLRYGRGEYLKALTYIAQKSFDESREAEEKHPVLVAGNFDFRNRMIIDFYKKYLPQTVELIYVDDNDVPVNALSWYLLQSQDWGYRAPEDLRVHGQKFKLTRNYPIAGGTGFAWYLYHRH